MRIWVAFCLVLLALVQIKVGSGYEIVQVASVKGFRRGECREWQRFKKKYNKVYESKRENIRRRQIFIANLRTIRAHNQRFLAGSEAYNCSINRHSDLTSAEFSARFLGLNGRLIGGLNAERSFVDMKGRKVFRAVKYDRVANFVDWRRTAVSPVKRQGFCGSCWAFSAAGALEGQIYIKTQKLINVSAQYFVDCVRTEMSEGCIGGSMDDAFQYSAANGIVLDSLYPYEESESWLGCQSSKEKLKGVKIKGFVQLAKQTEEELKAAVSNVGPISVGIDASLRSMQFYDYGVYFDKSCNASNINHGVLVVGYGSDTSFDPPQDYWIVKNSWGSTHGEHGYIRIARNRDNHCGIATMASYPLVSKSDSN